MFFSFYFRQLGYIVHDFEEHLEYNLTNYLDFSKFTLPVQKLLIKY
jgi:hypothetical protein